MKKRMIYYLALILFAVGFFAFNYNSVQKCNDILIKSVDMVDNNIVVEGKLISGYRSVRSVKSEKIGNNFYIKIEAVNDFFDAKSDFKVSIPNKKNNVEKVFLTDKDKSVEIYINSNFQNP